MTCLGEPKSTKSWSHVHQKQEVGDVDVSILIGFSIAKYSFWGKPVCGNLHVDIVSTERCLSINSQLSSTAVSIASSPQRIDGSADLSGRVGLEAMLMEDIKKNRRCLISQDRFKITSVFDTDSEFDWRNFKFQKPPCIADTLSALLPPSYHVTSASESSAVTKLQNWHRTDSD